MSKDIIATVERKTATGWAQEKGLRFTRQREGRGVFGWMRLRRTGKHPFWFRCPALYGMLCPDYAGFGVPQALGRPRGIPRNSPSYPALSGDIDCHHPSWVTLTELLAIDYDEPFVGEGQFRHEVLTLREFMNPQFFDDLNVLRKVGPPDDVRIVFYFV